MNSDFIVAVHAMVFLRHKSEIVSSMLLADNICTNPARVRRVMAKLKRAGLTVTREGRVDGGYYVPHDRTITLEEIGRALDVHFADFAWHSGDKERSCMISSGMSDYMEHLQTQLDQCCQNFLATITLEDVEAFLLRRTTLPGTISP